MYTVLIDTIDQGGACVTYGVQSSAGPKFRLPLQSERVIFLPAAKTAAANQRRFCDK